MLERLVQSDYERARRKALWRRLASWLTHRNNDLLPWEAVRESLHARVQSARGMQEVPLDHIVGSVGRYRDFDRAFLPRQTRTRERWLDIDRAHHRDTPLPAIDLYQIGDVYFVRDGNHRVSVARERGQAFIDAQVTRVQAPAQIHGLDDVFTWLRRQDELDFLERTQLYALGEGVRVELTLPGQYEKLLEHIAAHRWFMGIERRQPIPYAEAVASWYSRVYLPLVEIIRSSDVLREFPGRTEADLYLWLIEHLWYLRQSGHLPEGASVEEIVRGYADEFGHRPLTRLRRAVRRRAARFGPRHGAAPPAAPASVGSRTRAG